MVLLRRHGHIYVQLYISVDSLNTVFIKSDIHQLKKKKTGCSVYSLPVYSHSKLFRVVAHL